MALATVACALYTRIASPWHLLAPVCLVPWLAVLEATRSLRGALLVGAGFAAAFTGTTFGWFAPAIASYAAVPAGVGWLVLLLAAPLLQPQLITFAGARRLLRSRGAGDAYTALAGAAVYVGTEWLWGKLFGDTLGYALHPATWIRQAADLGGVHLLTVAVVLANEGVWAALRATSAARAATALAGVVAVLAALLGYGAVRTSQLAAVGDGAAVTAGVVQAGLSRYDQMAAEMGSWEAVRAILDTHFARSSELLARERFDVLVWPETVYPTTFGSPKSPDGAAFDREIAGFVATTGVPLIFGAYDLDDGREYNASVFLEPPDGGPLEFETYRKAALFPLTERVPWWLDVPLVRRALPWLGTWASGDGGAVVPLALPDGRSVRIAPLICYDVLAPELARAAVRAGAQLLVTLSNDSWFDGGVGPHLHLIGAAFRSIETRRPQVRATNTGVSAVISPLGDLTTTAGVGARTAFTARVTPRDAPVTLVVRWGDWVGPTAVVVAAVLVLGRLARRAPQALPRVGSRPAKGSAVS